MSRLAGILLSSEDASQQAASWFQHVTALFGQGRLLHSAQFAQGCLRLLHASHHSTDSLSVRSRDGVSLFLIGDLYNVTDLLRARGIPCAQENGHRDQPANNLLELYLQNGLKPLEELNGAFLVGIWDERDRTLHLLVDRLGLRRLYYTEVQGALCFATEVKALLAYADVSRSVDSRGLAHLLSLGFFLDDRTLYESIRLLRGGMVLSYRTGHRGIALRRYWSPRCGDGRVTAVQPLEDCADELGRRIQTALERQLVHVKRIGIQLSGGLDSRTLLGFIRKIRPASEVTTLTAGHAHAYDVRFAKRMAQLCQTRHYTLQLPGDVLIRRAAQAAWITEGMSGILGAWRVEISELAAPACDRLYVGFLGGGFTGYAAPLGAAGANPGLEALARQTFRAYNAVFSEQELSALLQPSLFKAVQGAAEEDFSRSIRNTQANAPEDRLMLADLLQRQQRFFGNFLLTFGSAVPVRTPFADNDVIDFLLAMPTPYKREKRAYREMLKRHLPELSRIPSAVTGLPLDVSRRRSVIHHLWERGIREVSRLSRGMIRTHDHHAFTHDGMWMRQPPFRSYLEGVFAGGESYLSEFMNVGEARRIFARHMQGDDAVYRKTNVLLGLIFWFEQAQRLCTSPLSAAAPMAVEVMP